MRKLHTTVIPDEEEVDSRARILRYALVVLLGIALLPLAAELLMSCLAQWQALVGRVEPPETPVLDSLETAWDWVSRNLRRHVRGLFLDLPWEPWQAMAIGAAWALFMMTAMRRRR
jgi:hypothetical protein